MVKQTRAPTILALLIAAVLVGAYVIVAQNNSTMNGAPGEAPSGFFH